MPSVRVKENEPFEVAMRRFKRSCEKAGILTEVRAREAYEKPTTARKRARAAAVKRNLKRLAREAAPFNAQAHPRKEKEVAKRGGHSGSSTSIRT